LWLFVTGIITVFVLAIGSSAPAARVVDEAEEASMRVNKITMLAAVDELRAATREPKV